MAEEEGFIPRFDVSVPQDIIDATMRDMERYLNTLVLFLVLMFLFLKILLMLL